MIKMSDHKPKKAKLGFTLIEIIVVLVIIAIMAAITIPAVTGYVNDSKKARVLSEGHDLLNAVQAGFTKESAVSYGSDAKYRYNSGEKKYYAYTNFVIIHADANDRVNGNRRVGYYISKHMPAEFKPYTSTDIYSKTNTVSEDSKKIGDKYAMFVVIDSSNGKIAELDYMRAGYMYIYKNGKVTTYDSNDNTHGFCSKEENPGWNIVTHSE